MKTLQRDNTQKEAIDENTGNVVIVKKKTKRGKGAKTHRRQQTQVDSYSIS